MRVDSFKISKNSICIYFRHNSELFAISERFEFENDGVFDRIYDYREVRSGDTCIVSYTVASYVRYGLFRRIKPGRSVCCRIVVSPEKIQTWIDGIMTRELVNTLLGNYTDNDNCK